MKLVSVYREKEATRILYDMLKIRAVEPDTNIGFGKLPSWRKHVAFVERRPYRAWYLIRIGTEYAGAVNLTKSDEVGVFLFPQFRGGGLGKKAVVALMKVAGRKRYLVNINPRNTRSIALFGGLGFSPVRHTYELMR